MSSNNTSAFIFTPEFIWDYHPILITVSLTICATNCLVITLFWTQAALRSAGNYMLFSLAISDLAVGLFGIPVNIACEMTYGNWGICLSSYIVNRFIAVSTVYHILWITLEKYTAIVYPLKHKSQFDKSKVKIICVCTWLAAVLLSVIELSWYMDHNDPYTEPSEDIRKKERIYNLIIFTAVFLVPITIMVFAYISIFHRILTQHSNKSLRKHTQHEERDIHAARVQRNVKTALLFFAIVLVFILGWFWWFFAIIFYYLQPSVQLIKFLTILRYSTSFVNPILYTFFKRDFNNTLRKFMNRSRLTPAIARSTPTITYSAPSDGTGSSFSGRRASKMRSKQDEAVPSNGCGDHI